MRRSLSRRLPHGSRPEPLGSGRERLARCGPVGCAVLLVVAAMACERRGGDEEREAERKRAREAIRAYSAKVPEADRYRADFEAAWRKANQLEDVAAYREAVREEVIPKLKSYRAALRTMPTGTSELERIHGIVVEAYDRALKAFRTFADGLAPGNVDARYETLRKTMEEVAAAEQRYREGLEAYYAKSQVLLVGGSGP